MRHQSNRCSLDAHCGHDDLERSLRKSQARVSNAHQSKCASRERLLSGTISIAGIGKIAEAITKENSGGLDPGTCPACRPMRKDLLLFGSDWNGLRSARRT